MGLSYQPKAITLSFKEGKPVTYKAQQVTYPTIKSKDLLAYAANAANVPLANIECCVQGLIEAIAYFCINGHRVVLPEVGGFFLGVKSKSVPMAENLNVKQAVQSVRLLFAPGTELRDMMTETTVESVRPSTGTAGTDFSGEGGTSQGGSQSGGNTGSNTGGNTGGDNGGGDNGGGGNGQLIDDGE